jgi:hypothetical protein
LWYILHFQIYPVMPTVGSIYISYEIPVNPMKSLCVSWYIFNG